MMAKSFYDLLLVEHNATFDEIKLAFKRRALQVHPDKGGSKEEFHLVYQALETLSDPVTRKKHDESLSKGYKQGSASKVQKPARRHRQTSSCQAKGDRKRRAGKKSQGSGKTGPVAQSKQTKLLIKIHDLLKQLPRNTRNDVITKQFSQKQRVLLEKWMVDHLEPSTSEAQALPIASSVPTASTLSLHSPTLKGKDMKHIMDGHCEDKTSLALAPSKKGFGKMRKGCKSKVRSCGFVQKYKGCRSYVAGISFDSMVIRTGSCDLHTALEYLVILTSVKHKMRNHQGMGGTYLQRLEEAWCHLPRIMAETWLTSSFVLWCLSRLVVSLARACGRLLPVTWLSSERCEVSLNRFSSMSKMWGRKVCIGATVLSILKMLGNDFKVQ